MTLYTFPWCTEWGRHVPFVVPWYKRNISEAHRQNDSNKRNGALLDSICLSRSRPHQTLSTPERTPHQGEFLRTPLCQPMSREPPLHTLRAPSIWLHRGQMTMIRGALSFLWVDPGHAKDHRTTWTRIGNRESFLVLEVWVRA